MPIKWPLKPKKVKSDAQFKSKTKSTTEENIENQSWSTTWVHPKTFLKSNLDPKNRPLGFQKFKNNPKIKSNTKVRIKEIKEN